MEEKKRPWGELFDAFLWTIIFLLRFDIVLEGVQELRLKDITALCVCVTLILLSLLRFFLYNRKTVLLWTEVVCVTLAAVFLTIYFENYFLRFLMWIMVCFDWYGVWEHYRRSR